MRAAVLHTISDIRVEEIDTPQLGPADILLKVAYCGVCGSDIPRINKGATHYYPIILGHEFSGVIVDVGNALSPDLTGKKAVCAPLMPEFSDPQCARGNYSLSKDYNFIGSNKQGGFAEYVGTPHSALTLRPAEFELIIRKELTLKGSWLNYSAPFPGWEWEYGVEMLTKQQVRIEELVVIEKGLCRNLKIPLIFWL